MMMVAVALYLLVATPAAVMTLPQKAYGKVLPIQTEQLRALLSMMAHIGLFTQ